MTTSEWPFVGRDEELRALVGRLAEREHDGQPGGEHGGVVLAGPPGAGKTRLALEALTLAERAGVVTAQVWATPHAATWPPGAPSSLLLPAHGEAATASDRAGLLRQTTDALVEQAGSRRLVLLIDDAHLLDDASATLVHQLAVSGAAFVLVTVRTGEAAPDPIVALWKDGLAERIEVGRLADEAVAELLSVVLGPLDPGTVQTLAERCQGNVLFLRELVLGALWHEALVVEDGHWRLRGPLSPSERLVELVERRFAGLDTAARSLLELVAYGEPLGYAELAALADPETVESLERSGLLSSRTDQRRMEVRLTHPLYADVLRAGVPDARARVMARSLAEVVEKTGARREKDALRVATWRLTGGGGSPAVLLAGAQAARRHNDLPLAERLARAAADAGAGFEATLLAAQLVGSQGRTADAERELLALASQAGDDAQRAEVALARVHNAVSWHTDAKLEVIDEAERSVTSTAWRDLLAAERLGLLALDDGPRAAADAAAPLLRRTQGGALARTCITAAYCLGQLGQLEEALVLTSRGQNVHADAPPLHHDAWWHQVMHARSLAFLGRFDEAEGLAVSGYQRARDRGTTEAQAMFALMLASTASERGRVRTAAARAGEAAALHQQLGKPLLVRHSGVHQALALALAGRPQAAAEALAVVDALDVPPSTVDEIAVTRARAWAEAAAGRVTSACSLLVQAASLGEKLGDLVGRAAALHDLARLGQARTVRQDLAGLADDIDGKLVLARVAHTEALARDDAAGLEDASQRFEDMGADLLAAEAAADAALARRRARQPRAAAADARRADVLAERSEWPATPALSTVHRPSELTPEERETALLAATGLANRQVARRLYLSVRTVENRLQRAYKKLGISRRTDLAGALGTDAETGPHPDSDM